MRLQNHGKDDQCSLCKISWIQWTLLQYTVWIPSRHITLDHLVCFETFIRNAFANKEHAIFRFRKSIWHNMEMWHFKKTFLIWGWKVSYLILFQVFYLADNLMSELIQLILKFMNRRYEFPREASSLLHYLL